MQKTILLFGATSGVGLWIAHNLLKTGHLVNVVCRNEDKLKRIFGENTSKFNKVIKMDIESTVEQWEANKGENPFAEHLEGVDILINAVGASKTRDVNHSRLIDLVANKLFVDACKEKNVGKFILVSSMYVTRPETMVAFILNTIVGNCLGHKIQAENYIRGSGLNYAIVRPGGLGG